MAHPCLAIIILAAGASSRMRGRDKLLEDVDGAPLLRQQVLKAMPRTTHPVIVTLPTAPHPRYQAVEDLSIECVPVPQAKNGMSASLRAGIAALPNSISVAMVLLADLPDLTSKDLRTVAEAVDLTTDTLIWRGATADGAPGHPIIFRKALFGAIEALTGDTGGRDIVKKAKGQVQLIPLPGNRARCDLDTPEDWDAWRAARTK